MATSTPVRLPWRSIARSVTGTTSSTFLCRAQCSAVPTMQQSFRRGFASDKSNTPKASASTPKPNPSSKPSPPAPSDTDNEPRLPRAVQSAYLRPLRRTSTFNVPVCDLQLRSYSVRNLEFFCDFALRSAYYLNLPARGPVPLPRIVERWTVPRSNFIFKKSQENFERRTCRRLIQITDADEESVRVWLAWLRKHAYYGVGMKANVWAFEGLGVGKRMDEQMEKMKGDLDVTWDRFAFRAGSETQEKALEIINREGRKAASGGTGPMVKPPL